ncbi:MAG: hydrolase, partial [Aeromicrobium sp.]
MRVTLVQLVSATDSATNRKDIVDQLAELTASDSLDLVVMPEGAMHDFGAPDLDLRPIAEPLDGPFVQMLTAEAG